MAAKLHINNKKVLPETLSNIAEIIEENAEKNTKELDFFKEKIIQLQSEKAKLMATYYSIIEDTFVPQQRKATIIKAIKEVSSKIELTKNRIAFTKSNSNPTLTLKNNIMPEIEPQILIDRIPAEITTDIPLTELAATAEKQTNEQETIPIEFEEIDLAEKATADCGDCDEEHPCEECKEIAMQQEQKKTTTSKADKKGFFKKNWKWLVIAALVVVVGVFIFKRK